jgi:hypothetical protein
MADVDRDACVRAYEFLGPLVHVPVLRNFRPRGQGQGAHITSLPSHELIKLIRSESAQAPVAAVDLIGKALHNKVGDRVTTLYGAINAAWREHDDLREGLPRYPRCRRNREALDRLYRQTGEEDEEEEEEEGEED